ncbi:MAG: 6-phosphogluconolactonase [Planctomycetota bacterium]
MTQTCFYVHDEPAQLFRAAAQRISELATVAIAERGRFLLALSGGSTPRALFDVLALAPFRDGIDWDCVEFFWGDERAVAPDHPDSNFQMANEALLQPLQIAPERIHRMVGEHADPGTAARDYARTIATVAGPGSDAPPRLDLILLGLGDDAHTASLFPGTAALAETESWVVANDVPQLDTTRLTMTFPLINAAREVLFLATGAKKTEAIAAVWNDHGANADAATTPAGRVRPHDGQLTWFVDRAAAPDQASMYLEDEIVE